MVNVFMDFFAIIGIVVTARYFWKKLAIWLDSFQGFVILPEEKAEEFEQHLWGRG